jgi:hypothetical protein
MLRRMLTYGALAGGLTIGAIMLSMTLLGTDHVGSEWLGYTVMLLALSLIFMGVKRYRDDELGGVIRFGTAVGVGLGITLVASVVYVAAWEVYLWSTDYAFMDMYVRAEIAAREAQGLGGEALQSEIEYLRRMQENYARPLFRLPMTMMEIFPVGLLITLASAGILRNPNVLPAEG